MNKNPLLALKKLGQHLWLDNLSRALLQGGALQRLIKQDGVDGVTSNPSIFHKAIADSPYYRDDLRRLRASHLDIEARYEALVIPDIQAACDLLWPVYVASDAEAGYVSLEVSPLLADDAEATVAAAKRLAKAVDRENLLLKVPATTAGLLAFERLTAAGIRVNVTLIFSLAQYAAVAQAYLRGAMGWLESAGSRRQLRSVASIFLSRIDTLVDQRLSAINTAQAASLKGRAGVALAKICHKHYLDIFHGPDFALLRLAHIRPQAPLWASTGNKDPAASDVRYVEPLIGINTVTTLPDATLAAFRDHGQVADTLKAGLDDALAHRAALAELGIDLDEVGATLQREGVQLFIDAYELLLQSVAGSD
ncbi:MAG: transaldolase [Azonexus sp.]|nr:transaldolase [Azonexus sp.]MDP3637759.1 transaldolase [Azonexus sp.]MDZ4315645.1 transaldolase [Azonexus sp.]